MADRYVPGQSGRDVFHFGRPENHGDSYRSKGYGDFSFRMSGRHSEHSTGRIARTPLRQPLRPALGRFDDSRNHNAPRTRTGRFEIPDGSTSRHAGKSHGRAPGAYRNARRGTSERILLVAERAPTPDQMEGMTEAEARFKNVDDLSESEEIEAQIDFSESGQGCDSDDGEIVEPAQKRARIQESVTEKKWSNPDPYTSLPPPDESKGKRKDVVRLIRKAKANANCSKDTTPSGNGLDYISFSAEYDDCGGPSDGNIGIPGSGHYSASAGPKFSHLDHLHPDRYGAKGTAFDAAKVGEQGNESAQSARWSPIDQILEPNSENIAAQHTGNPPPSLPSLGSINVDVWPPPPPTPLSASPPLKYGTNTGAKRRHRNLTGDFQDSTASIGRARKKSAFGVDMVPSWRPKPGINAYPWMRRNYHTTDGVGVRLHNEICDFYDFLKPQPFENDLRERLVQDVQKCLDSNLPGAQVRFFGSFAAGLYLPEGDMDLVVFSKLYKKTGEPVLAQKKQLYSFGDMLRRTGTAKPGSVAVIAKAKVPIVKYVDRKTLLRVDISFENDTGVRANRTYQLWKTQFPAMPVLVTLIKQYLLMRNLNEVHSGGLGGFSVTCLVVSLMQHMPHLMSGNMDPMSNLGELFLTLLDFYGNKFSLENTGIELDPPRYFPKKYDTRIRVKPNQPIKLAIMDPNRPDNDISGGSLQVGQIFKAWAMSFDSLQARMADLCSGRVADDNGSILGCLYAGDYSSCMRQRAHLRALHPSGP